MKTTKTLSGARQKSTGRNNTHTKTLDKRFFQDKRARYEKTKLMCKYCRAIYNGKSWQPFEKLNPKMIDELKMATCPACHEQFDHISDGVLHLKGPGITPIKKEIMNEIKNIADHEESRDILSRVERIEDNKEEVRVYTTKNQLAVELGKKIASAHKGGKLEIKWSKQDKPVEVYWYFEGKTSLKGKKK